MVQLDDGAQGGEQGWKKNSGSSRYRFKIASITLISLLNIEIS